MSEPTIQGDTNLTQPSGEQPTSVEWEPAWLCKLIAEERRQAKIEAIDECLLIIGPDEPLKDWLEKADPAAIRNLHRAALRDYLTTLRGENNE